MTQLIVKVFNHVKKQLVGKSRWFSIVYVSGTWDYFYRYLVIQVPGPKTVNLVETAQEVEDLSIDHKDFGFDLARLSYLKKQHEFFCQKFGQEAISICF